MKHLTIASAMALAGAAITVPVASASVPDPCYITHADPISTSIVSWDSDRPRRLTVMTELGERRHWLDGCKPTTVAWTGVFVDTSTYRLRPSITQVHVGAVIEGWPAAATSR